MFTRVTRADAAVTPLPGRDWHTYVSPATVPTDHLSMGVSVYEPGSHPAGHVHEAEEETVYCVRGRGRLICSEGDAELEPGVAVFIPVGTFHETEAYADAELELLCVFTPPVVPGSYEQGAKA
ncbi:MAG TPA: cupin domain-containing protein [Candidatus Limnocylindrales bacterium]